MIIVEMSGGLGNQMFQYALYKAIEAKKTDVCLDTSFYTCVKQISQPEVCRFPNVQYKTAELHEASILRGYGYDDNVIDKINHHLFKGKRNLYSENIDKGYQPEIFNLNHVYLNGYWQSERYFADIRQTLLDNFAFPNSISRNNDEELKSLKEMMTDSESVSVHIRRGDYLKKDLRPIYGDICTADYYHRALEYVHSRIRNPRIFMFSDDMQWVKDNLMEPEMVLVNEMSEWDGMTDMYLMTQCRHHIIANSSFSWWGAWLGNNLDKIVVAPVRWFNNHSQTDMICKEWVKI